MAAGIIKALFGIGKGQMKTIPWTKLTPELHNQLSSQLGKLMFVIKSQNLKLTKFQEDYLRNQLKHMDEFEKRVLTKTETPKPKGEVRPFMGFTPEVIPGGKKLVPSRTGKKKPINVNYTEAEKKLGFPIGEVKYLEDLVDIEKMGMKNYYNLVMDRADEIRKRMRVTDEGGTKIPYREFETLQNELNEIDALMTRVRKEVPADKRSFLKFEDEVTKPDPEDLASGGLARVGMAIGGFTKAEVLIQMLKNTIKGSNDPYVKKTFPNFIKELQKNPELALDPNVWKQFTTGLPKNQRLVVHSDDSVDFFTQSEFGPHNIEKTLEFQNKHNLSRDQANTILRMEPEDRVLEMKRLETIADRSRTKQASGGIAGQLHLNRPGYSKGKVVTGILNFLKSKKGIGKYVPYSKDYRVDMKKLMKGDKPIKLFSGQTKRQSNTMKTFKKDAEFFKTTPEKIAKDRFKDQWFTPYRDYAEGFYDPSDLTATMRTVDLTPKEIAMAKRYVKKMNKLKSISVARMKGLPHAPNINLTLDDNTVIIPRIKLKKLKKDKRLKTDYRIPEKIKKKLGLAEGGRIGYANGSPAVDPRMLQSYEQNKAENEAQRVINQLGRQNISNKGDQQALSLASPVATFFASATPYKNLSALRTEAMDKSLFDIIEKKGTPEGTIGYSDYDSSQTAGSEFPALDQMLKNLAAGQMSAADFANATTLGRLNYKIDPDTGKVSFGSNKYDFRPDVADQGGLFGYLAKKANERGININPNVTMPTTQSTSTPMMSQQDFYNQFYGVPYAGYEDQYFKTLQEGDPNYDEISGSSSAGSFADLVDRGLVQRYEGPTDYNVYKSSFAKGGRIGYAQGTKKPGERYYLPTKGKEWLHAMPEIDPYKKFFRRQNKLMKFKDSKGLAEILGV